MVSLLATRLSRTEPVAPVCFLTVAATLPAKASRNVATASGLESSAVPNFAESNVNRPAFASSEDAPPLVQYRWRQRSGWSRIVVNAAGVASPLVNGSEEEYITEHYWGYTRQRDGGTLEYRVTHPRWRVWQVQHATLDGDHAELYGAGLAAAIRGTPHSAFLADGSAVAVHRPTRL